MPKFQWDADKSRANKAKHGISFETASLIWNDPDYLVFPDAIYDGEERWLAVGTVGLTTVLVAVHTIRDSSGIELVRIISARKATSHERRRYEQAAFD